MPRWGEVQVDDRVRWLESETDELRQAIAGHRVYSVLRGLPQVRTFMSHHVFAVWDFMSLLKALQARLTCTTLPWEPRGSADTRRFINELVMEEESDQHPRREGFTSHFELYREAMVEAGADTGPIDRFVALVREDVGVGDALARSGAPPACRDFVSTTWGFITDGSLPDVTAAFALGREQLIPQMFAPLQEAQGGGFTDRVDLFMRYLDRHIQLDSEDHGPLAFGMLGHACGDSSDNWHAARAAAERALRARLALWDATAQAMQEGVAEPLSPS
jgi:hypothetical protein